MRHDTASQIRVLIADRYPLLREGLARAIHQDPTLHLVGEATESAEALEAISRLAPDVAVLDVELHVIPMLTAMAQQGFATRVVCLTADCRRDRAVEAVAAGALGYLSKRVRADMVCHAIRRVAAGDAALCEEAQTAVTAELRFRQEADRPLLTMRELEVLRRVAEGLTYREIGEELHLAPTTVKSYVLRACERLGARDRLAAVVIAMRRGILD